ncbi:MAG: AMP-binding protein, partial [Wenzhouxiangella sp.]
MSEEKIYPIAATSSDALIDRDQYERMYAASIEDPGKFWAEQARSRLDWIRPFTRVKDTSFAKDDLHIKWFEDGTLNVSSNCIDRHLAQHGNQTAIIWEGDDPQVSRHISYNELHEQVCRLANALKTHGVKKGDRVTLYMPMVPEAAFAMLACARIGAIHSVVFGGFSPGALANRIVDCQSSIVITADESVRGGKKVPLKSNVDKALEADEVTTIEKVIVVRRTGSDIAWQQDRDLWYHEITAAAEPDCEAEEMNAEDPLFILYTSGS